MTDADFPIIWVPTKWDPETTPNGTIRRNNIFLLAHCGFFMFNFLNVCCILLFHGFVLQLLSHNFLMKMALLTCFGQMISCLCSIHRYNTNDEYGYWAHASVLTGLVTYTFFNFVMLHVFLNHHRNQSIYMPLGMFIWIVLATLCWVAGRENWETDDFYYFRNFISLSTAFQFVSYILVLRAFSKAEIRLNGGSPVSNVVVTRLLIIAIGLVLLAVACALTAMPIFQYPATGMTFSVMVIVVSLVGEMDFMGEEAMAEVTDDTPANEQSGLL